MPHLIGTDEAGYGPNLGPLIVAATAWDGADDAPGDLYEHLAEVISPTADALAHRRVPIADSKQLYRPGGGLATLETGVLAVLSAVDRLPTTWRGAWDALAPSDAPTLDGIPWYAAYDEPLPLAAEAMVVDDLASCLRNGLQRCGVELRHVRAAAVFPQRFNDLVDACDSKGAVLSQTTLSLVRDLVADAPSGPVQVVCDRHGGRRKYQPVLQNVFPDYLVEVRAEGRRESVYRFGPANQRIEVQFRVGGEAFLPAALASMTAKYLRELAMRAVNAFWAKHVPGIRPTAGYPVDARRFRSEIEAQLAPLAIDERVLWRSR